MSHRFIPVHCDLRFCIKKDILKVHTLKMYVLSSGFPHRKISCNSFLSEVLSLPSEILVVPSH